MSEPAVLIATAKVRPGCEDAFTAWKGRHDTIIAKFPGFISSDIMPPDEHSDTWTIILNFKTAVELSAWQESTERAAIVAELLPLTSGGNLGEVMQKEEPGKAQPGTVVTQVIFSLIKPGKEDAYREWAARMQQEQSKYPGYKGMYLQPPSTKGGHWTTLLRFDTSEHLEAWLVAPERVKMLQEARPLIEKEELLRLATSFPGWVPLNPLTGEGPPNWKTALLVLLGLYPIVVLELHFLSPLLRGETPPLATFIGNVISVALTSFLTMPLFVGWFSWWLFVDAKSPKNATLKGLILLAAIFAAQVVFFWWFFVKMFPQF